MEERLQKVLAAAGVASRREAERMIAEGLVCVDGKVVTEMGVKVDPQRQQVTVAGQPVEVPERKTYLLLNKPAGYVTTRSDPHASRTVMELVREVDVPVHPVGRLDKQTEGALILTNDGALTQLLTHPSYGVQKRYQAWVSGVPDEEALATLRSGVPLDDGLTGPAQVRLLFATEKSAVLELVIHEGRKRQVRRMLEAVGHPVERLRRVAIGPVSIRGLPQGAWRHLRQKEVEALIRAARRACRQPGAAAETPPVGGHVKTGVRAAQTPGQARRVSRKPSPEAGKRGTSAAVGSRQPRAGVGGAARGGGRGASNS